MQTRTVTVDYARPRGYDVGYRAENNFTLLALPIPGELENADSYRVYFESTVGEYLQTELLTPSDGYVTVKITSDIVPEPGNIAAQLVAFADGEIVGYAPMITGSAKVSIPDGTERLSHSLAAEIALNTAARHTHDNKSVLDKLAETDGKPTYDGKAIGGASTADDVGYTNTSLENVTNVKGALDTLVETTEQHGKDILAVGEVIDTLDAFVTELKTEAHTHDNKATLDLLTAADGKLKYNGSDVGAELFKIPMTLTETDDGYTVACDVTKAEVDAAYTAGKLPVVLASAEGGAVTYILPLLYPVNAEDNLYYVFGLTVNLTLVIATLDLDGTWSVDFGDISASDLSYTNSAMQGVYNAGAALDWLATNSTVTKNSIISALGYTPQAVTAQVTSGTAITLADNTEYRLTSVTTLTLTYPTGNFECWLKLTFAASGSITVTLPTGTKYIGSAPSFANGETWEMSMKDGVVVAQKVGDGT